MSSVYVTEPPSSGKVVVHTTLGSLDIELWPKEAPLACRNFCQLCMEGYYDDVIFHRVIKDFMAQTGDPTGTGTGGESVYGKPFKDEYHQRLKFNRRGLVAMANLNADDTNTSQFFVSLGACPWLDRKHTIFGKVVGNSAFNALKFQDIACDAEDRPLAPPKILSTEVLECPFDDIVPRMSRKEREAAARAAETADKQKALAALTAKSRKRDLNLVSFDDDDGEEEEEGDEHEQQERVSSKRSRRRMRSAFDVDNVVTQDKTQSDVTPDNKGDGDVGLEPLESATVTTSAAAAAATGENTAASIPVKGNSLSNDTELSKGSDDGNNDDGNHDDDDGKREEEGAGADRSTQQLNAKEAKRAKREQERAEKRERKRRAKELKLARDQARDDALAKARSEHPNGGGVGESSVSSAAGHKSSVMSVVEQRRRLFLDKHKKTKDREANTLSMLQAFKNKLSAAVSKSDESGEQQGQPEGADAESDTRAATVSSRPESYKGGIGENALEGQSDGDDSDGGAWLTKELVFKRQHMDADARTAEDYTLIDPRTEKGKREMAERDRRRGSGGHKATAVAAGRKGGKDSHARGGYDRHGDKRGEGHGATGRQEVRPQRRSRERTKRRGRSR